MMRSAGTVYLSACTPLATIAADGRFSLTLLVYDRIGSLQTEPWRMVWSGDKAAAFWAKHDADLKAGAPLYIEAENLRLHAYTQRRCEVHAKVTTMHLADARWPSPQAHRRLGDEAFAATSQRTDAETHAENHA
jgi:hypothetical protein